ncbi:hypothetical protein Moror_9034 [Moniliophthora roreri MCA 2997]|uniref:Uncharacterized protein n=1 Tax=Moniliophthora roreri (strain MCA 2997) TaxID=1381753 RepID=V2XJC6_MONRO|nr:hypothetical protein Moror_9034 [Moniliophthora roreri MCA 2997]
MPKETQPFALKNVLRDLAILRVSSTDFSELLPATSEHADPNNPHEVSLQKSYEFAREARAAIRLKDRGIVEVDVSEPLEECRAALDEFLKGLEGHS